MKAKLTLQDKNHHAKMDLLLEFKNETCLEEIVERLSEYFHIIVRVLND